MEDKIRVTEEKLAIAVREGDASSRDFLRTYLVELQKKENLLLQQQIQQAPRATQPGNYLHPVNFIVLLPSFHRIFTYLYFICFWWISFDEIILLMSFYFYFTDFQGLMVQGTFLVMESGSPNLQWEWLAWDWLAESAYSLWNTTNERRKNSSHHY